MADSPFAFLRGAAPLFDVILRKEGSFGRGPAGGGGLVGDLHLENYGVFRDAKNAPVFHVNDFDALRDGPWRFDVLRLLTSILLARDVLHLSGTEALALAEAALDGHQRGLTGGRATVPAFVKTLLDEARATPVGKLLEKHVAGAKLVRDEKHPPADAKTLERIPALLAQWAAQLPQNERPKPAQLELLDVCRRIAGTGSLGVERLLLLVRGDAGQAPWLLDFKQVESSAEAIVGAVRAALPKIPALEGWAHFGELELLGKKLGAGEDKLDLDTLEPDDVEAVVPYLGLLAGEAHRRLARTATKRWTPKETAALLASARGLASLHEETFWDFCALTAGYG